MKLRSRLSIPDISYQDEKTQDKRHPVVTVMYVDHGKPLLDAIKSK